MKKAKEFIIKTLAPETKLTTNPLYLAFTEIMIQPSGRLHSYTEATTISKRSEINRNIKAVAGNIFLQQLTNSKYCRRKELQNTLRTEI